MNAILCVYRCHTTIIEVLVCVVFFFQAEDGIRDLVRSRGLGDVYKRQAVKSSVPSARIEGLLEEIGLVLGRKCCIKWQEMTLSLIHI